MGGKTLAALGATALVIGVLVLGALTRPNPVGLAAEPGTTTTTEQLERPVDLDNFTVEQIEVGTQLAWERVAAVDGFHPRDLIEHENGLYLFASPTQPWEYGPDSLWAWRLSPGNEWEPLGEVIRPIHRITAIHPTDQGLIALESAGPDITVWRSEDASHWAPELVPIDGDGTITAYADNAVASDRFLAITGSLNQDPTALIEGGLSENLGLDIELNRYGWGYKSGADDLSIVIWGPLGLRGLEVSLGEIGLTEAERSLIEPSGAAAPDVAVWARGEGSGWHQSSIEGAHWIQSLALTDQELLAFGHGLVGSNIWSSLDGGLRWEPASIRQRPHSVVPWDEGFIGLRDGFIGFLVSDDGVHWDITGNSDDFDLPVQFGWHAGPVSAGTGGIAAVFAGWRMPDESTPTDPVSLKGGSATLDIDFVTNTLVLEVAGRTQSWRLYDDDLDEHVSLDLSKDLVHFHHTETGESLATFRGAQLRQAEFEYWRRRDAANRLQAFVFSPDGQRWTIQDLATDLGDDASVRSLVVTADVVAAAVEPHDDSSLAEPGVEIWAAPIP